MIRTSPGSICAGNCFGKSRGSKARLIFPEGFRELVRIKLGGEVGRSYFVVHCDNDYKSRDQHIFFDFNHVKTTKDNRFYFERSSNLGQVQGPKCFPQLYYSVFQQLIS